jgi:LPXTG-motif cell wall-anchored protein
MRKIIGWLALAVGVAFLAAFGLSATPAAATTAPHPVESTCHQGWYVNHDEAALLPEQVEDGFLFDGPSLVHRAVTPVKLADAGTGASLNATVITGVAPLFKYETLNPYSTINVLSDGKVWSSKIPSGPGSQADPVNSVTLLPGIAPYTANTVIYSIGAGYGNDTGNKAVVTSITYGPTTYELDCGVQESPSATPSASASASPSPSANGGTSTATATPSTSTSPPAGNLPLTGTPIWALVVVGLGVLAGGAGLLYVSRQRRYEA